MNLAFPAAVLFAVLLPGVIFLRAYYGHRGEPSKNVSPSTRTAANAGSVRSGVDKPDMVSLQEEIARSPIPALLLHVIWGFGCDFLGHPIDIKAFLALVIGSFGKENAFFHPALDSVAHNPGWVLAYFLSVYAGAAFLGWVTARSVWKYRLDLRWRSLRYEEWFYLFRGELGLLQKSKPNEANRVLRTQVSAVVACSSELLIYRGTLANYTARRGELDEIWLNFPQRRRLSDDKPGDTQREKFYNIDGNLLVLKASDLLTINLKYITWADVVPVLKEYADRDKTASGKPSS